MQDSTPPSKSRLILQWTFSVLFIFSLIGFSFWNAADRMPEISIPTPKMPNPNAYTYYLRAGSLLKDDQKVSDAAPHFRRFARYKYRTFTLGQKEALLQENKTSLDSLRAGFAYEYRSPPARSYSDTFAYYAKFRSVARLLSLEAQTKADKGDWTGAVESDLDILRLGEDVARGGPITGSLVSTAIKNIGVGHLSRMLSHLTPAQSRAFIPRLEAIRARHVPWADTLQEEKWMTQASMMEIFRRTQWRRALISMVGIGQNGPSATGAAQAIFISRAKILHDYTRYIDQCIATARQPYASRPALPAVPGDPFNQAMVGSYVQGRDQDVAGEVAIAQMSLHLALHAYKAEHGANPTSLTQLVPSYIAKLPDDPSGASGTFAYTRDKVGYSLVEQAATPMGITNFYGYNGN